MDETAVKRSHNYMTMFVDMDERRVIQVEEGKGADTVEKFVHAFQEQGGDTS
ncbi:transposase [Thermodesulfovibrionales bacterium]|nr:transposase [Thermodesulfovibrionales bacterium]